MSVARDRLEHIAQQLRHLETENRKLKEEKAEWTRQPALEPEIQFVPYGGVLWEQSEKTIKSIAYCPRCRITMAALPPGSDEMLVCAQCNFTAPFPPSQVGALAKRLESELVSA